jgi:hypothetical protein
MVCAAGRRLSTFQQKRGSSSKQEWGLVTPNHVATTAPDHCSCAAQPLPQRPEEGPVTARAPQQLNTAAAVAHLQFALAMHVSNCSGCRGEANAASSRFDMMVVAAAVAQGVDSV